MGMIVPSGLNGLLASQNVLTALQPRRWAYVAQRFSKFQSNLQLTAAQQADGFTKLSGVNACLNRAYYNSNSDSDNSFVVGSWGKNTAIRPPRDIDLYFKLPEEVYYRFNTYSNNKQSAWLQEVKIILQKTYPTTTSIRGDGPVVVVGFGSQSIEVVPAFALNNNGYWVCDTKSGGSYKETHPWAEIAYIDQSDKRNAYNLRPIIRMLKAWQTNCSVPIKSFHLELLAVEFLEQSPWRFNDNFWYDWLVRDFFGYILNRSNAFINIPGTGELMWLGDGWKSKVVSAYGRAKYACDYEDKSLMYAAGAE